MKEKIRSYSIITMGTLIVACGVYFFEYPNQFSTGGVSGISIILSNLTNALSFGELVLILNFFLLLLGFLVFGRKFAFKTMYSATLLSLTIFILEKTVPLNNPLTDQKMLELFFDSILIALGSAMIFNEEGSTGGTDILAMILKKYTTLNIGKALLLVDVVTVCLSLAVFGVETGMYSLFAIVLRALVVDYYIENLNISKCFFIITDKPDKVCEFITDNISRGATISECKGAFTNEDKTVIMTVTDRKEAIHLKRMIKEIDKNAFTIICNSSDIIGNGFRAMI